MPARSRRAAAASAARHGLRASSCGRRVDHRRQGRRSQHPGLLRQRGVRRLRRDRAHHRRPRRDRAAHERGRLRPARLLLPPGHRGRGVYSAYLTPISDPSYLFPQIAATPSGGFVMLGEIPRGGSYNEVRGVPRRASRLRGAAVRVSRRLAVRRVDHGDLRRHVSATASPAFPCIAAATNGRVGIAITDFGGNVRLVESSDGSFSPGTITVTAAHDVHRREHRRRRLDVDAVSPVHPLPSRLRGTTPHVVWSELQARRNGGRP